jgi:hypothetical protein
MGAGAAVAMGPLGRSVSGLPDEKRRAHARYPRCVLDWVGPLEFPARILLEIEFDHNRQKPAH